MENKHTKGDWFLSGHREIVAMPNQIKICKIDLISQADVNKGCVEMSANAKLIAAAPLLLEACKQAISTLDHFKGDTVVKEVIEKIGIVIKKAV